MVLDGLRIIVIGPEGIVDDDTPTTVNFPRGQGDTVTVVEALNPK